MVRFKQAEKLQGGEIERALLSLLKEESTLALNGKRLRGSRREEAQTLHSSRWQG